MFMLGGGNFRSSSQGYNGGLLVGGKRKRKVVKHFSFEAEHVLFGKTPIGITFRQKVKYSAPSKVVTGRAF